MNSRGVEAVMPGGDEHRPQQIREERRREKHREREARRPALRGITEGEVPDEHMVIG
jgi:hypothetical protein